MPAKILGETLLSQYRVDAFIASTPLGEYYRVWDSWHNKTRGLTILPKEIGDDAEALKQLEGESNRRRAISHQNLIPYAGLFQTAKFAFLLEDWIDGPSLRDVLAQALLTVNESLIYIKALCAGLSHLHAQNLLHLNLAPEMIHIDRQGNIRLGGVGMSIRTGEKGFLRHEKISHLYAAPEQFNSKPLTPAADTYALAVILYEMLTGHWLTGKAASRSAEKIRETHLNITPPAPISFNPEIPDHFSRMMLWALRKKPDDRLKTTTELLSSLCLAARVNVNEIALHTDPAPAPVTAGILASWEFLPPAAPSLIAADTPPLEERIAAVSAPSQKAKPNSSLRLALGLLFIGMIALLLWGIRPSTPTPTIPGPPAQIPIDYTPAPSVTPLAKPTSIHGGQIIFTCTRGDFNQLCLINADGTGYARLTNQLAHDYYPIFGPQGGSIVFASNRNGAFDLYLLVTTTGKLYQLTDHIGNVVSPSFSPDGRKIVFANRASTGPTSIWMVNQDGLNPHIVYTGPNAIVGVAWSPDGNTIAYAMSIGVVDSYEVFLMGADGKNSHRVTQGLNGIGGSLAWSPDGKSLLICAGGSGSKDIYRLDVATGQTTQLTHGGNNAAASYSPDGQWIVFNSLRKNDQADLYIMKADGSGVRQLTSDPEPDWQPQWQP